MLTLIVLPLASAARRTTDIQTVPGGNLVVSAGGTSPPMMTSGIGFLLIQRILGGRERGVRVHVVRLGRQLVLAHADALVHGLGDFLLGGGLGLGGHVVSWWMCEDRERRLLRPSQVGARVELARRFTSRFPRCSRPPLQAPGSGQALHWRWRFRQQGIWSAAGCPLAYPVRVLQAWTEPLDQSRSSELAHHRP